MSSTNQLERWGRAHIKKSQGFIGVYASNQLLAVDKIKTPMVCVLNYDPTNMPGSHWVAVSVQSSAVWWFDSYGLAPDADDLLIGHRTHFKKWLSQICKRLGLHTYAYNCVDLQSPGETTCGLWALYFAKNGPNKGLESFGTDREYNDRLIRQLVRL